MHRVRYFNRRLLRAYTSVTTCTTGDHVHHRRNQSPRDQGCGGEGLSVREAASPSASSSASQCSRSATPVQNVSGNAITKFSASILLTPCCTPSTWKTGSELPMSEAERARVRGVSRAVADALRARVRRALLGQCGRSQMPRVPGASGALRQSANGARSGAAAAHWSRKTSRARARSVPSTSRPCPSLRARSARPSRCPGLLRLAAGRRTASLRTRAALALPHKISMSRDVPVHDDEDPCKHEEHP